MDSLLACLAVFFGTNPLATVVTIFIFDIPRDVLSLMSLALGRIRQKNTIAPGSSGPKSADVAVVIPSHNDVEGILVSLESLREQTLPPARIIVVSDGCTDETIPVMESQRARGQIDELIVNDWRMGRATSGNIALQYVDEAFVLFIDCDTRLDPNAIAALRERLCSRPNAAACSGNIIVGNERASIWTAIQQLEYMIAIDFGREFADTFNAVACCSGALTMYRSTTLRNAGGVSPGSGEDLGTTLRLRRAGYEVHFEAEAWAYTQVPESLVALIKQRLRWDRDAFRIQILQYQQFRKQGRDEPLSNTLQRYDYMLFTFLPTLLMPFLLPILTHVPASDLPAFVIGGYTFLLLLSLVTLAPVMMTYRGPVSPFLLLLWPIFPLYQGVLMKAVRLYAYLSEAIWHSSIHDGYLPKRIRHRLNGRH